jgi:hypothetical protein
MTWINVEEREPPSAVRWLVCDSDGWMAIAIFNGLYWEFDEGSESYLKITHWQPLPEKPKCIL